MSRLVFALICTGMLLPSLLVPPPAHADKVDDYALEKSTVICDALTQKPFVGTVIQLVHAIVVDTGDPGFAGSVIATAVYEYCPTPANIATLSRFVEAFAPTRTPTQQAHMGTRI